MSIEAQPSELEKVKGEAWLPPFPTLMDNASAAVMQLDVQGRVQLWNHAAQKLFGWNSLEVLGKPSPTVPNELWEDNQAWFLRCLGGQTMSGVQMKRRRKDGSTVNLHAWAWPVRSESGTILGVMKMFFPVGEQATRQEASADQLLKHQTEQAQRFHSALVSLSKTDHPSLEKALQTLTAVASQALQVERVSIWLFSQDNQRIVCRCLYQQSSKRFDSGFELTALDYPEYFRALEECRTIAAGDAQLDPRTREYKSSYLEPFGITSMLDVPIRLHGKEIGIVCHEHVGVARDWSQAEQAFAGAIADFVSLSFENQEHARAEAALQHSEQLLAAVIHGSPMGIQIFDIQGDLRRQNAAMIELNAKLMHPAEIGSYNVFQAAPFHSYDAAAMATRTLAGEIVEHSWRYQPPATTEINNENGLQIDSICYPVLGKHREVTGLACFHHDVTERRRLEEQLQQSQRLESLGLLAGTIAHDFNGLLTAIYGFIDLAQNELPGNHTARNYLQSSLQAVHRATDLTQQLLAYAGKGKRESSSFDLSGVVLEVSDMLRNLVQRSGQLQTQFSPDLPEVSGDVTQIRQVIMNLISNAAEAQIHKQGTITIRTGRATLDANAISNCQVMAMDAMPGDFALVQVSDQGDGMTQAVRDRIFDPFFTTKTKGRGLGLAAVVGIVRNHKAALRVESVVSQGTTFTLYLPIPPTC